LNLNFLKNFEKMSKETVIKSIEILICSCKSIESLKKLYLYVAELENTEVLSSNDINNRLYEVFIDQVGEFKECRSQTKRKKAIMRIFGIKKWNDF